MITAVAENFEPPRQLTLTRWRRGQHRREKWGVETSIFEERVARLGFSSPTRPPRNQNRPTSAHSLGVITVSNNVSNNVSTRSPGRSFDGAIGDFPRTPSREEMIGASDARALELQRARFLEVRHQEAGDARFRSERPFEPLIFDFPQIHWGAPRECMLAKTRVLMGFGTKKSRKL